MQYNTPASQIIAKPWISLFQKQHISQIACARDIYVLKMLQWIYVEVDGNAEKNFTFLITSLSRLIDKCKVS